MRSAPFLLLKAWIASNGGEVGVFENPGLVRVLLATLFFFPRNIVVRVDYRGLLALYGFGYPERAGGVRFDSV